MDKNELSIDSTIDEIFLSIGKEVSGKQAFPKSSKELINVGKKWFELNKNKLKENICGNEKIKQIRENSTGLEAVSAIADVISSLIIGVPPFTVALLLSKYGFDKLCSD